MPLTITINFQPGRYTPKGLPLLVSIAKDKCWKSQFETGTSNGGLTAHPQGKRWHWEQRLFCGAYDQTPSSERPKYGALNYKHLETGASPRFGCAFFRLKPEITQRSTFCYPDSVFEPERIEDHTALDQVIALAESDQKDLLDPLNHYIEAHIHGNLFLTDMESLVLDPVYKHTEIEQWAAQLGLPLQWHGGYELHLDTLREYPDYRGAHCLSVAKKVARDGLLNPLLLDQALQEEHDPQDIKKLWHYLARFGYKGNHKGSEHAV